MFTDAPIGVTAGFVVLPLLLAAAFLFACDWAGRRVGDSASTRRRRLWRVGMALFVWLLLTTLAAASGVLRKADVTPPPFAFLVLAVTAVGVGVPLSSLGTLLVRGLPVWALAGFQVFRLPLELLLHAAWQAGVLPVQMTYAGRNFDIVTGITAGILGALLLRRELPRWLIAAWNLLGLALLANVVAVAILSTPLFAAFGPDHVLTLVTYPPFVWLPAVLVVAALMGHVLVWRWLANTRPGADFSRGSP